MKRKSRSYRSPFSAQKTDVEVVWKYVQYVLSPSEIRNNIKENAKLLNKARKQNMRSSLQSKRSINTKELKEPQTTKRISAVLTEACSEIDDPLSKDQSVVSKSLDKKESRDVIKKKESKKESILIRRTAPIMNKMENPQIAISNLKLLFEQNKPQTFFGIRKPKTFELIPDKDVKDDLLKNTSIEAVFQMFVKSKSDSGSKESPKRQSIQNRSISMKLNSLGLTEICDRFSDINKTVKTSVVKKEVQEILNKIAVDFLIDKECLFRLSGFRKIEVPDTEDKLSRERILYLYVNKYYRESHPRYKDQIIPAEETEFEKNIMNNCVLNNKLLLRVMNNQNFYPQKLRGDMIEIDAKLSIPIDEMVGKVADFDNKLKPGQKKVKSKLGYKKKKLNALDDICSDCKEFNGFYRPLFEFWGSDVIEKNEISGAIESKNIKDVVTILCSILSSHRNVPGSQAFILAQQLIKHGLNNNLLLIELSNNVEGWLDQMLKCLISKFSSIRLESFITICYLVSKPSYIATINANLFNETFYDLTATILRCMDLKSDEFPLYYSLLGVIFHFVPSQIILDCVMERGPYSSEVEMITKWPKFVYLAMKYWSSQQFNASPIYLRRVVETLENHYLREPLSRKYLKKAIVCIVKRFNITSNMLTVWPKVTTIYPD